MRIQGRMRKRALLTTSARLRWRCAGLQPMKLSRGAVFPGRGTEAEHGQGLAGGGVDEVAHLGAGQGVVAEVVVAGDEGVPQPPLGAGGDGFDTQRAHRVERRRGLEQ